MCAPYENVEKLENEKEVFENLYEIGKNRNLIHAHDLTIEDLVQIGALKKYEIDLLSFGAIEEVVERVQEIGVENGLW